MPCSAAEGERINSFAVVCYVPDPLGAFLDQLRRDLVPGCIARSHVTILPPRELVVEEPQAAQSLHAGLRHAASSRLDLGAVEVFEGTSVIYLGLRSGTATLEHLHDILNTGDLWFNEPYRYHPHITLAQNFDPTRLAELSAIARGRWSEWSGARWFDLDVLTFVQNTLGNRWLDLEEIRLAEPVGRRR